MAELQQDIPAKKAGSILVEVPSHEEHKAVDYEHKAVPV